MTTPAQTTQPTTAPAQPESVQPTQPTPAPAQPESVQPTPAQPDSAPVQPTPAPEPEPAEPVHALHFKPEMKKLTAQIPDIKTTQVSHRELENWHAQIMEKEAKSNEKTSQLEKQIQELKGEIKALQISIKEIEQSIAPPEETKKKAPPKTTPLFESLSSDSDEKDSVQALMEMLPDGLTSDALQFVQEGRKELAMDIKKGPVLRVALLGPEGVGKSSLVNIWTTILKDSKRIYTGVIQSKNLAISCNDRILRITPISQLEITEVFGLNDKTVNDYALRAILRNQVDINQYKRGQELPDHLKHVDLKDQMHCPVFVLPSWYANKDPATWLESFNNWVSVVMRLQKRPILVLTFADMAHASEEVALKRPIGTKVDPKNLYSIPAIQQVMIKMSKLTPFNLADIFPVKTYTHERTRNAGLEGLALQPLIQAVSQARCLLDEQYDEVIAPGEPSQEGASVDGQ